MIKYLNYRPFVNEAEGKPYVECTGLSTDTKPNEVSLNSLFLELDTKTLYYCSRSGGESEEVVYEGEYTERGGDPFIYEGKLDADSIEVTFDGTVYHCERGETVYPPLDEGDDPTIVTYYGATIDVETNVIDFSEYPFRLESSSVAVTCRCKDSGTHSLSITSLVTTEAEWTKYGEGGISGTINVYYLNDGQEVIDLTSQVAQGESITLPLYDGNEAGFKPFYAGGTEKGDQITSGDTFTPTSEYIFTEVPSGFPISGATAPFVCFDVVTFG